MRALLLTLSLLMAWNILSAQEVDVLVVGADTLEYRYTPVGQTSHTQTGIEKFGLRLNNYFTFAHDDPRKVKFSAIGAPAYSENTGLRLNAVAVLNYRTQGCHSPHILSLKGMASLRGCYSVVIDGRNHLTSVAHQLSYGGGFDYSRTYIYGLDYATSLAGDRGAYRARNYEAYLRYAYAVARDLTLGVTADYTHRRVLGTDGRAEEILGVSLPLFWGVGIGVNIIYSTRKVEDVNLVRGVYLKAENRVYPKALNSSNSTSYALSVVADYYQPLWRGSLLAVDLYGEYHSADTPWLVRANMGGDSRMRGYYYGRFNGNSLVTMQLELRQRVWEGFVVAGWGGCGAISSPDDPMSWSRVLPTYGAGLRWYFNSTSLVRIDYGFGCNSRALVVGYSEAF